MAESPSPTADINALLGKLLKAIQESQRSKSALASLELRESRQKVGIVVDNSRQKFQVWTKTWIDNGTTPDGISTDQLWGSEGSMDILKLQRVVEQNARKIEDELLRKDDDSISHIGWRRSLRSSFMKKNSSLILKRPSLMELAIQLSRSIDELWTYSEVSFDSLHGIFAHQLGPPLRERLLARSLYARTGSLALFEACNQSKADYSLDIDLFNENFEVRNKKRRRSSMSSMMPSGTFHHLFAQDRQETNTVHELIIGNVTKPVDPENPNVEIVEFDIKASDLAVYNSWPALDPKSDFILIQPNTAHAPSFFRIIEPPTVLDWNGESESLAELLYKQRIESSLEHRPLTQEARVKLAYKLVECGLYLLGTPWLASLSSKRLRRMKHGDQCPFVLDVQTLDLEDLYFEDPDALSEQAQLFSIGVLLVEIALSDERNRANITDPEMRKSKILPLVEGSMGSLYSAATAFCLADRKSTPYFGRPQKYRYPEETGWTSYLTELLEDYHAQVFSRLEEMHEIDATSPT